MIITNDGSQPADNLHIFIQTSNKIINVTNVFSTTNVSLVRPTQQALERSTPAPVNSNFSEIFIPKLVHGIGSKVEIETLLESQRKGYNVSAVYDQGSTIGSFSPNIVRDSFSFFSFFSDISFWPIIVTFSISIAQFYYILTKARRKRRETTKLVVGVIRDMRRLIIDNPTATQPLGLELAKLRKDLAIVFKNLHDYMIIDDLLSKLHKRHEMIRELESEGTPLHPINMAMINKEILDLSKKASDIDWKNYL